MALFGGKAEAKKGDMLYAWTNDADLAKKAECWGRHWFPQVCTREQDGWMPCAGSAVLTARCSPNHRYESQDLDACAGSLHRVLLLLSKLVMEYVPSSLARARNGGQGLRLMGLLGFQSGNWSTLTISSGSVQTAVDRSARSLPGR